MINLIKIVQEILFFQALFLNLPLAVLVFMSIRKKIYIFANKTPKIHIERSLLVSRSLVKGIVFANIDVDKTFCLKLHKSGKVKKIHFNSQFSLSLRNRAN